MKRRASKPPLPMPEECPFSNRCPAWQPSDVRQKMKTEEDYLGGVDLTGLPSQARQVLIALGQHQSEVPITQKCPSCGQLLVVENKGSTWVVSCQCGLCDDNLRGL